MTDIYQQLKSWGHDLEKAGQILDHPPHDPANLWKLRQRLDSWYYDVEKTLDYNPRTPYRQCMYTLQSMINCLIEETERQLCRKGWD